MQQRLRKNPFPTDCTESEFRARQNANTPGMTALDSTSPIPLASNAVVTQLIADHPISTSSELCLRLHLATMPDWRKLPLEAGAIWRVPAYADEAGRGKWIRGYFSGSPGFCSPQSPRSSTTRSRQSRLPTYAAVFQSAAIPEHGSRPLCFRANRRHGGLALDAGHFFLAPLDAVPHRAMRGVEHA